MTNLRFANESARPLVFAPLSPYGGAVFRGCALRFAPCARHFSPSGLRRTAVGAGMHFFPQTQAFAPEKMPEMTYTPSFLIKASFFRDFVNTLPCLPLGRQVFCGNASGGWRKFCTARKACWDEARAEMLSNFFGGTRRLLGTQKGYVPVQTCEPVCDNGFGSPCILRK